MMGERMTGQEALFYGFRSTLPNQTKQPNLIKFIK